MARRSRRSSPASTRTAQWTSKPLHVADSTAPCGSDAIRGGKTSGHCFRPASRAQPQALAMNHRPVLLALLLAACGAPPPPVTTLAVERLPEALPPSKPKACELAASQRARVGGLLAEGRLDRAQRVIAHADKLCPASAGESAAHRDVIQNELQREPAMTVEALLAAGLAAERAGDRAGAQRLFDRALHAVERTSGPVVLDAPNGPPGHVHAVAWSGKGKSAQVVIGHSNGMSIYDPETLVLRFSFPAREKVHAVAASPDGRTIISGSLEGARLWDAETGREILHVDGNHDEVAWSPDGKSFLLVDRFSRRLEIWSAAARVQLRVIDIPALKGDDRLSVLAVALGNDAVAAGLRDGKVKLFRVSDGKELRTLEGHKEGLEAVAFSPDGKLLATATTKETRVWDTRTGKSLHTLTPGFTKSIAWSPDGVALVTATSRGFVWWSARTGKELRRGANRGHHAIAFDAEGARILAADDDEVGIHDAGSGEPRARLARHAQAVQAVAWARTGEFAIGSWDDSVRIWDGDAGALRRTIKDADSVTALALDPDGKLVASGTTEPSATLWDAATGDRLRAFPVKQGWSSAAAFSPSGKLLAMGMDTEVSVIDVATRSVIRTFGPFKEEVTSLAFRPTESLLAIGTRESKVHLVDLGSGRQTAEEDVGNSVSALVWSPNGLRLHVAENDLVTFEIDGDVVKDRHTHPGNDGYVGGLALRTDGGLAAVGYSKGALGIFDLPAGTLLRKIQIHDDLIRGAAFRADGKWVLTGSDDGTSRITAVDGRRSVLLRAVAGTEDAYAFTPGPEGRVELFGEAGRPGLRCRVGRDVHPFSLCQERVTVRGLVAKVMAGDDAYLAP
ncbi:High-affnity carbon uptake protein Hat/HatR [Minicystis rosea]|nr:High-affnity carbon uptake protein Hat/HatR [Minicystis rosea]